MIKKYIVLLAGRCFFLISQKIALHPYIAVSSRLIWSNTWNVSGWVVLFRTILSPNFVTTKSRMPSVARLKDNHIFCPRQRHGILESPSGWAVLFHTILSPNFATTSGPVLPYPSMHNIYNSKTVLVSTHASKEYPNHCTYAYNKSNACMQPASTTFLTTKLCL